MKEKSKLYREAKAERIQHHQTSSSTNAKGFSLEEDQEISEEDQETQKVCMNVNPKQQSKWQQDDSYQ